jgi:hypothetical protein
MPRRACLNVNSLGPDEAVNQKYGRRDKRRRLPIPGGVSPEQLAHNLNLSHVRATEPTRITVFPLATLDARSMIKSSQMQPEKMHVVVDLELEGSCMIGSYFATV